MTLPTLWRSDELGVPMAPVLTPWTVPLAVYCAANRRAVHRRVY
ncbi:MAG TPA: hypothetical protein VNF27_09730 [Candidatus Binataceae bacterium]|nr:hypothetical protein [Candidatus Binataceae bacterium]